MPRKKKEQSNILNALTEDQRIALHFQHLDSIGELKDEIASLVGKLRAKRKEVKSDLGADGLAEIDEAIRQATPEGEARAQARLDTMLRVARWHGASLGQQMALLDALPPRNFKAEGKLAGLRGLAGKPPDELGQSDAQLWLEGYHAGQAVLAEGFGRTPGPEGEAEHKARVETATAEAETAVKRKRGRPRKAPPEAQGAADGEAEGDDARDLRPPYARPENQEHPKDPSIGTEPATHRVVQ